MSFFFFLLKAGLYGILMWGIYCAALRGSTNYRLSRTFLLIAAMLPLLLPAIHFETAQAPPLARLSMLLPEVFAGAASTPVAHSYSIITLLQWSYAAVSIILLAQYVAALTRLQMRLRKGHTVMQAGHRILIDTSIGPGTLWRQIFFPGAEIDPVILRHEIAHIKAGHRRDALLAQVLRILFWPMPHLWLIARELKMVHEFEADSDAIRETGIDAYSTLLLSQAFGTTQFSGGQTFFYRPLKRRIMMLQKTEKGAAFIRRIAGAATLVFIVCGAAVFMQCRQKELAPAAEMKAPPGASYVHSAEVVYKTADTMPSFKGDLNEYLGKNLHYPESARNKGHQGRVAVHFYVDIDGHVKMPFPLRAASDSALTNEALRVVREMPDWKPGMLHGEPVAVEYTLPITFRLDQ